MTNERQPDNIFFQASLDSQRDVLIFSIDRNYTYRTFNNAFRSATSYAYGTEVKAGMNLFESITKESDRDKAKANCDRALLGESHHTIEEYGTINPAVYETHYNPIFDIQGGVIGVTVLSSNITARVVAEQQVKILSKELESFTYTAAHDLRVPLRIINGYSKILSEDHKSTLDDEAQKLVKIIVTQSAHMGRLIDDLLNFAQLGRANLNHKLTQVRDIAQQAIDEQVLKYEDTRTKFTIGDLPPCSCDPSLIRIVFSNLISNAVKFSSKSKEPIVEVGAKIISSHPVYYVKDNGIGFNMEYSGKLFGLFQRLHKATEYDGTGVGLAIVQRIVGKHGGKVWFESEPGKGATFYFTL
jgi:light-regulated signal transduction histidine kinase (bacteriophytochrome)